MKRRHDETMPALDATIVGRRRNFPRQPNTLVYAFRSLVAILIRIYLRLYHRLEIIGSAHLRINGSFVLVANHCSHLDTLCLLSALPLRRLHRAFPAAAADYFFQNVPRLWLATVVVNALPFARQMGVRQSLALTRNLLASSGNILVIFPEGTRSRSGDLQEFKAGIGALVAGSNVRVLPCCLQGTFAAWPKGKRLPRPRKVRLTIGAPREYQSASLEKESVESIARDLEDAVRRLGAA